MPITNSITEWRKPTIFNSPEVPDTFLPSDLPTTGSVWFDWSDASTITATSNNINQIDDKFGNNINASQGVAALQPVLATDAKGSYARFTGSGSFELPSPNYLNLSTAISAKSIFWVGTYDDTNFSTLIGSDVDTIESHIFLHNYQYAISLDGAVGDVGSWYQDGTFKATGGNVGTSGEIGNNDRQHSVVYSTPDPDSNINLIGAFTYNTNATGGYGGKIRELIMYDSYLNDTDRQKVEQYLMNKYGLN